MKKALASLLALLLLVGLFPTALALEEDAPEDPAEYAAWKASLTEESEDTARLASASSAAQFRNEYVEAYVNRDGYYTIGTTGGDPAKSSDDNKILLYGHPDSTTTETKFIVDGDEYWFSNYVTDVRYENDDDGERLVADASFADLEVQQILTFEENAQSGNPDLIGIRYVYENTSDDAKTVGVRIMLDTMLGNNDGAPFRVNGQDVTREVEFSGGDVPQYWQSVDNLTNPAVVANGTFYASASERPDKVQFTYWYAIRGAAWDFQIDSSRYVTSDSAVAAYFNPRILPAGTSRSVITYYGIGRMVPIEDDNLLINVAAPTTLSASESGGYLNNPFVITAYLKNLSSQTLTNVDVSLDIENAPLIINATDADEPMTLAPEGEETVQWTLTAIPQTAETTALYTIEGNYDGCPDDKHPKAEKSISLAALTDTERTVSFNLNGASGSAPAAQTIPIGTYVSKPADPAWSGHTFSGWYANPKTVGLPWFNSLNNNRGEPVTNNITLYAKWDAPEQESAYHTLTFRAEGEDDLIILVTDGTSLTAEQIPDVPAKAGYDGMWDVSDFSNISSDMLINAVYSLKPVTLDITPETLTINVGETAQLSASESGVVWSSYNTDVAEVSASGVVTGKAPGTVNIAASLTTNGSTVTSVCPVTVNAVLTGIEVTPPDQTEYTEGDPINLAGMVVQAVYDNGREKVPVSDYTVSGYNANPPEFAKDETGIRINPDEEEVEETITVAYTVGDKTFTDTFDVIINRKPPEVVAVSITRRLEKRLNYLQGEKLDLTGMHIVVMYDDDDTRDLPKVGNITNNQIPEGVTITGYDMNRVGFQVVTLSYGGKSTQFSVRVLSGPTDPDRNVDGVIPPRMSSTSVQGGKKLVLSSPDGGTIYYTTDGSIPTSRSTQYTAGSEIILDETTIAKAIVVKDGQTSAVTSARIYVPRVERPTASHPTGSTLTAGTLVTFQSSTPGASIRYTIDGGTPADEGRYGTSVLVDRSMTIRAVAVKDGYEASKALTVRYTVPYQEPERDAARIVVNEGISMAEDRFSVPVVIHTFNDSKVEGFLFSVTFDHTKFQFESVSSPAISGSPLFTAIDGDTVTVRCDNISVDSGEMCELNFRAEDSAEDGTYPLNIVRDTIGIRTSTNKPLVVEFQDGSIQLGGSHNSQLEPPSMSVSLTNTSGADVMKLGDDTRTVTANISLENAQNIAWGTTASLNSATLMADGDFSKVANVFVAIYDRVGAMVDMETWEIDLSDPLYLVFTHEISIPENVEVGSVKFMILSESMTPLMAASGLAT